MKVIAVIGFFKRTSAFGIAIVIKTFICNKSLMKITISVILALSVSKLLALLEMKSILISLSFNTLKSKAFRSLASLHEEIIYLIYIYMFFFRL